MKKKEKMKGLTAHVDSILEESKLMRVHTFATDRQLKSGQGAILLFVVQHPIPSYLEQITYKQTMTFRVKKTTCDDGET